MQHKVLAIAMAIATSTAAFAGDIDVSSASPNSREAGIDKALTATSENDFRKVAGSEWQSLGAGRYQASDAQGQRVEIAFGESALQADLAELSAAAANNRQALAQQTDPVKRAELQSSLKANELAISALSTADSHNKAAIGTGVLNGCSAGVALTSTFDPAIGMVDYGYAKIEAMTQEFGPYGPGAGQVTLVATVDGYSRTVSGGMGGISLLSVDQWGGPNWGCQMETRASIQPYCNVTGYRSVKWTATCASAYAGTPPVRTYSNYRK